MSFNFPDAPTVGELVTLPGGEVFHWSGDFWRIGPMTGAMIIPPVLTLLTPSSSHMAAGAFTLTVDGADFDGLTSIAVDGTPIITTYVSPTQLTAGVTLPAIAGDHVITAVKEGVVSNELLFTVIAATVTTIAPTSVVQSTAAFTLTVTGANFTANTKITLDGVVQTTTLVSPTSMTCSVTPPLQGGAASALVNVQTATTPDKTLTYAAPSVPVLSSLNPNPVDYFVGDFTLRALGSGFTPACRIDARFPGGPPAQVATTYVSPTELTMPLVSYQVGLVPGGATVTIINGTLVSNAITLTTT